MTETDDQAGRRAPRVTERVVSSYQWDLWREATLRGSRRDEVLSISIGSLVALVGAAYGLDLSDDRIARLSVLIYAPVLGAGVWAWVRSRLRRRLGRRVGLEVRAVVVPALVPRLTDEHVFSLFNVSGALVSEEMTVIRVERRDAAVALVASEVGAGWFGPFDGEILAGGEVSGGDAGGGFGDGGGGGGGGDG